MNDNNGDIDNLSQNSEIKTNFEKLNNTVKKDRSRKSMIFQKKIIFIILILLIAFGLLFIICINLTGRSAAIKAVKNFFKVTKDNYPNNIEAILDTVVIDNNLWANNLDETDRALKIDEALCIFSEFDTMEIKKVTAAREHAIINVVLKSKNINNIETSISLKKSSGKWKIDFAIELTNLHFLIDKINNTNGNKEEDINNINNIFDNNFIIYEKYIADVMPLSIIEYKDFIFYLDSSANICRIKTDGSEKKKITNYVNKGIERFCIYNDTIYYNFHDIEDNYKGDYGITLTMKIDSNDKKEILWPRDDYTTELICHGQTTFESDAIYYLNMNSIKKSDLNGNNRTILFHGLNKNIILKEIININKSNIYFTAEAHNTATYGVESMLCRIKKDGTDFEVIAGAKNSMINSLSTGKYKYREDMYYIYIHFNENEDLLRINKSSGSIDRFFTLKLFYDFEVTDDYIVIAADIPNSDVHSILFLTKNGNALNPRIYDVGKWSVNDNKIAYTKIINGKENLYVSPIEPFTQHHIMQIDVLDIMFIGDWIYFIEPFFANEGLHRLQYDFEANMIDYYQQLSKGSVIKAPMKVGNWVYYYTNTGILLFNGESISKPIKIETSDRTIEWCLSDSEKDTTEEKLILLNEFRSLFADFFNIQAKFFLNNSEEIYNLLTLNSKYKSVLYATKKRWESVNIQSMEYPSIEICEFTVSNNSAYVNVYCSIEMIADGNEYSTDFHLDYKLKKHSNKWLVEDIIVKDELKHDFDILFMFY